MKWLERVIKWTEDATARAQRSLLLSRLNKAERRMQEAFSELARLGEENPERKTNQHYNVRHALKQSMMDLAQYKRELGLVDNVAAEFRRIRGGAVR